MELKDILPDNSYVTIESYCGHTLAKISYVSDKGKDGWSNKRDLSPELIQYFKDVLGQLFVERADGYFYENTVEASRKLNETKLKLSYRYPQLYERFKVAG